MLLIICLCLAIIFEIVDSAIGMMYGTLLTPILISLNFPANEVVPSILLSQGISGIFGSRYHHKFGHVDYKGFTKDLKIVLIIILTGIFAISLGVTFAKNIPDKLLRSYIAVLTILMGILCLIKPHFSFKWWKIFLIGILASFNKSATGGGFGPICSTGLTLGGLKTKTGIGITTLTEVPLCILAFTLYVTTNSFSNFNLLGVLIVGASIGAIIGPYLCSKLDLNLIQKLVGYFAIISGIILIYKIATMI